MALHETLLEWETRYWQAAGDAGFYREHLAEEALMVFPAPFGIMDREATIEAVAASPAWKSVEIEDSHLLEVGADAAVLAYRASARDQSDSEYKAYASSVYVLRDGVWTLVLHQQTPI